MYVKVDGDVLQFDQYAGRQRRVAYLNTQIRPCSWLSKNGFNLQGRRTPPEGNSKLSRGLPGRLLGRGCVGYELLEPKTDGFLTPGKKRAPATKRITPPSPEGWESMSGRNGLAGFSGAAGCPTRSPSFPAGC